MSTVTINSAEIQDAITLIRDCFPSTSAELRTAISYTQTELEHVRTLLKHRGGNDQRLIADELNVLARLADLKLQLAREAA